MAQTARISARSDKLIKEMASLTGQSKIEIIEQALETYRRNERMHLMNNAYQKLRENKSDWKEELAERKELEGSIGDGL